MITTTERENEVPEVAKELISNKPDRCEPAGYSENRKTFAIRYFDGLGNCTSEQARESGYFVYRVVDPNDEEWIEVQFKLEPESVQE